MEGSGESCLHLVKPVVAQARTHGRDYQIVLFDYSGEQFSSLEELVIEGHKLLAEEFVGRPLLVWAQSFGNLIAARIACHSDFNLWGLLLVSPFTSLPQLSCRLGAATTRFTPGFLYRISIDPVARYVFGPVGDQPNHPFFIAMRNMDPKTVSRRTGWLIDRTFLEEFAALEAPTKIWLGSKDHLLNLPQQSGIFESLVAQRRNFEFGLIHGSGHVVLPAEIVEQANQQFLAWLLTLPYEKI
jgi:hypothetical protein